MTCLQKSLIVLSPFVCTCTHTLATHACIHDMILLQKLFVIIKEPKNEGVRFHNSYRVCKSIFSRFRGGNQWTENHWKIKIFKCNVFALCPEIICPEIIMSSHYITYLFWLFLLETELLPLIIMTGELEQERWHRGQLRENLATLDLTSQWLNAVCKRAQAKVAFLMPYLWKKGEKQFDVRDIQSIEEYT